MPNKIQVSYSVASYVPDFMKENGIKRCHTPQGNSLQGVYVMVLVTVHINKTRPTWSLYYKSVSIPSPLNNPSVFRSTFQNVVKQVTAKPGHAVPDLQPLQKHPSPALLPEVRIALRMSLLPTNKSGRFPVTRFEAGSRRGF
jgi:hypothetical protein